MKFSTLLISFFISVYCFSQNLNEAETLFNNKQYKKAQEIFEVLLKRRPNDNLLNYKVARCAYEQKNYFDAVTFFEKSGTKYPLTNFYLADACFLSYQFDKAKTYAAYYLEKPTNDKSIISRVEYILKKSEIGTKLINRIENIQIIDSITVNKANFLSYYKYSQDLGTLTQSAIKFSAKTQQDKISFTTQRNDRLCFSDSVKGQMDLFTSDKLLEEWSKPVPFSETLNTKANENYPFIMPDGITIYFASDGEGSMGGYDIFMSKYSSAAKDFLTPENVGFPFNSTANDYMLVLDEVQQKGWFSTDRNQSPGKIAIYTFLLSTDKKYYRTTDSVAMLNVATLRSFQKVRKNVASRKNNFSENTSNKPENKNQQIPRSIIINDSILYESTDKFTDENARISYIEHLELEKLHANKQLELQKARWNFDKLQPDEQKKLANDILILEKELPQLHRRSKKALQAAISFENKNIASKH